MDYIYAHYQRLELNDFMISNPEYIMGKIINMIDTHVTIQVADDMIGLLDTYKTCS